MFDPLKVIAQAEEELRREKFREAVDAEKARLRARDSRSVWRRILDAIPFTVTRKKK